MIRHLSRDERLEASEGRATAEAGHHLAGCRECREQVESLARVLDEVRAVEVPEPSPLFWDHLSARVREAIAAEPPLDRGRRAAPRWRAVWLRPALALLAVGLIAGVAVRLAGPGRGVGVDRVLVAPARVTAPDMELAAGDDWQFIVDVAEASDWESVEGADLDARPGSSELAVSDLSPDEQRALVQLLNDALAASPDDEPQAGKGDV